MRIHTGKITKELCEKEILAFSPKTEAEAIFIQNKLFEMGFGWSEGGKKIFEPDYCVSHGMQLNKKTIYSSYNKDKSILCTTAQLDENYDPKDIKHLTGDELVREVFNKLSQRIETLEAEIKELKNPTVVRKLKPPDGLG